LHLPGRVQYLPIVSPERRFARGLLLVAVALTVFWTLGEIVARTFDLVDRLNGFPRRLFVASDDPELAYRLRPNVDTEARGVHVVTNGLGLRGPPVAKHPAGGTHRVLVLGDSVAFGFRLEQADTFPVLLEHELETREGGAWEVLNGGVEGYNTRYQLALLRSSLIDLAPETVVLVFNLNDYDHGPVMGPLGVLTLDQSQRMRTSSIAARSEFLLLLRWLVATQGRVWVGSAPPEATPAPGDTSPFTPLDRYVSAIRKQYYRAPDDERWQQMVDALRGIADLCRARGIRLVIAIVPDGDQIGVAEPDLTPQRKLAEVCRTLALDCIDLQPSFAASAEGAGLFIDIMHPNADGQRLMARDVAAHLLARER
jgi:lysophospholipase L1-like esterase